ncbi:hypothetical protein G8C92_11770 [Paenibacillus donghaensis]|uniref:hypothetical protein n=1 Tax=Paenibacillus donghaensis TaxID=414771 RepID=UPI00188425B5|nr:hypothetical protein [Paenibacillus donghaensis]MBE9914711.1 hypothetical protein [Paenibacillus donghaensis]
MVSKINSKMIRKWLNDSSQPTIREDIHKYQNLVNREDPLPLQLSEIRGLLKEMNDKGKQEMASNLDITFFHNQRKKFPHLLFQKEINQFILQAAKDNNRKRQFISALIYEVADLIENEDESTWDAFIRELELLSNRCGLYHTYWALYFHPAREPLHDSWHSQIELFKTRLAQIDAPNIEASAVKEELPVPSDLNTARELKLKNKIDNLAAKLQEAERSKQSLRKELDHKTKLLMQQQLKLEQATLKEQQLELKMQQDKEQWQESRNRQKKHDLFWKQLQTSWEEEKSALLEQLQDAGKALSKSEKLVIQKDKELTALKREIREMGHRSQDSKESASHLLSGLYENMDEINRKLKNSPHKSELRAQLKKILDLMDLLEDYLDQDEPESAVEQPEAPPAETSQMMEAEQNKPDEDEVQTFNGIFYRRDHGGYISLENGEVFNITESMVYQHDLQHEAEVLCRPKPKDGTVYYDIELLFQGDDTYSPVRQFKGYVLLGAYHVWYCVDMNYPDQRYPIHYKDIEIQKPVDGAPCTFNIAENSRVARLVRLHPVNGPVPAETKTGASTPSTAITDYGPKKEKPEPFLEGCKIVIIGGQRKWFESVVVETGAELIHENGTSPERVYPDLKSSQALFLLLTATSHRASWGTIEVAKQYQIPYFVIQGSKSNLRKLLWDNRQQIKQGI